jgi:alkaline phosphatase D
MQVGIRAKQDLTRRQLLVRTASTVAIAGLGSFAKPYLSRASDRPQIPSGLASGDVSAGSAVVWARVDRAARMQVEWSTLESFKTVVGVASSQASAEHDFTSKALLEGLPPGQDIFYRVRFEDLDAGISGETQVGHFRTAPLDKGFIVCLVRRRCGPGMGHRSLSRRHAHLWDHAGKPSGFFRSFGGSYLRRLSYSR